MRQLLTIRVNSAWEWLRQDPVRFLNTCLSLYVLYHFFWPAPAHPGRAIFLLFVFIIIFLRRTSARKRRYLCYLDFLLAALSIACFGHIILNHYVISLRIGEPTLLDIMMGLICIVVVVEGTRRGMGLVLTMVVIVFLVYIFLGQYLPGYLGGHGGVDINRVATNLYLSTATDNIFGSATYVFFKYVFLFVMFGKVLEKTGALSFLMDLVRAMVGSIRGGPAMLAVLSSNLVGCISGVATANVMITGVISIPLMKRIGFKPHVAGAVEAAASTGGQFMPPVMGTAAFLMMNFLGVPYLVIIKAALIPALLYFLGVLSAVFFYSHRIGAESLPRSEVPRLRVVLKRREGIAFVGGFSVLLCLIVLRFSPTMAAMYAIGATAVLSLITPQRMNFRKSVDVLSETARDFVSLGAAGAGIGIIIGITLLSGLAYRLTHLLLAFTGGQILPSLIVIMVACIILGMGLPTLIIYILLSVMVAPAVIKLGILPIAAHLFIFYSGLLALVTPPVATAAYVAAGLAGANFWKTGIFATLFALPAYIIPFAFVLSNSLLMMGSVSSITLATATASLGVILLANAVAGSFRGYIDGARRALFAIAAVLLILPGQQQAIIGAMLAIFGVGSLLFQRRVTTRRRRP